jgi:hypothetical protein
VLNITALGGATDFSEESGRTIQKSRVDSLITLVSNYLDMQMAMAGYHIPLEVIAGESWPSHQTTYLQLVCALGVAARIFGHALAPAPTLVRDGGRLGNIFDEQYGTEIRKIYNHNDGSSQIRLRAKWRPHSAAERVMEIPYGPTSDYMQGAFDPTATLTFDDVTERVWAITKAFKDLEVPWDYAYDLGATKGLGATIHEANL